MLTANRPSLAATIRAAEVTGSASAAQWEDIRFGWEIAKEMGRLDVGQSIIVNDKAVIAVEAVEGTTDATSCVLEDRPCAGGGLCALHNAWAQARTQMLRELAETPLSTVSRPAATVGRRRGSDQR